MGEIDTKISFIIPVYNSEKYLKKCVDSVLSLSDFYENFEIILVDDGSLDSSPAICDNYSAIYLNVITIHKENGGVASARNVGIEKSSGGYLFFIDNDDWVDSEKIYNLVNLIKKEGGPDIVINNYYLANEDGTKSVGNNFFDYNLINKMCPDGVLKYFINKRINIMAPWQYIVKKDVIVSNKIFFNTNQNGVDDSLFTPLVFCYCNSFIINNEMVYFWRQRLDSQSKKIIDGKYVKKMMSTIEILSLNLSKMNGEAKINYLYFSLYKNFLALFGQYYKYSRKDKKLLKDYCQNNKDLIKKSALRSGFVHKILNLFFGCFGLVVGFKLACFKGGIRPFINRSRYSSKNF